MHCNLRVCIGSWTFPLFQRPIVNQVRVVVTVKNIPLLVQNGRPLSVSFLAILIA